MIELVRGWPPHGGRAFELRSGLFLGTADGPGVDARLGEVAFETRRHVLTVVSFGSRS